MFSTEGVWCAYSLAYHSDKSTWERYVWSNHAEILNVKIQAKTDSNSAFLKIMLVDLNNHHLDKH